MKIKKTTLVEWLYIKKEKHSTQTVETQEENLFVAVEKALKETLENKQLIRIKIFIRVEAIIFDCNLQPDKNIFIGTMQKKDNNIALENPHTNKKVDCKKINIEEINNFFDVYKYA